MTLYTLYIYMQSASLSINVAILFVAQAGHHFAQQIDRQSALQTAEKENTDRIPFTLTFHPHNHAVKSIILKNFKLLQNDSETGTIFSQPPLISFKRDKNIGNFLVRSSFQTNDQSGTFKCARSRCKTCPFIHNVEKMSEPKRSIKITDHLTCTSAYGSLQPFPTSKHFGKTLEQKFIFQIGTLNTHGINERFHSTNLFLLSRLHIPTSSVAQFSTYKPTHKPQFLQSL